MSSFSNYLSDAVLNYVFRGVAMPTIGGLYVALYTAAPSDTGGGTEVTGNGYARVQIARTTGGWVAPANKSGGGRQVTNSAEVAWPESTGAWGNCTHVGVVDAATAGNLLAWSALTPARNVDGAGIVVRVKASDLVPSLD